MTKEFSPDRLDVKAFAQAGGQLSGHDSLLKYERLSHEAKSLHPDLRVDWTATGEIRTALGGIGQVWLHLQAQATFPMDCQRCLTPVDVPLAVERSFRFVTDEATAEALDDDSEEDLLALSREFDLRELIEDELLMALPVVPRHDECPTAVPLASSDDDFEAASAEKPNPFAALASLRKEEKGQ
ncbi:MAG: YceD family protein [Acidovorax sp.]